MTSEPTSRDRFIQLMKHDILKLDLADLDFGIYRILNRRRDVIEAFFDETLPAALDAALEGGESESEFSESEEDRLYNHLYTFFSRYYRDGDFQPQQRRARDARYSVPYSGEDVHFHWRSKGSYYVKTTEELKSYAYRDGRWRVRFELVEAYQEPDNVKGTARYFTPVPDDCRLEHAAGDEFVVPFAYRRLTDAEHSRYGRQGEIEGDSAQERVVRDLAEGIDVPEALSKAELVQHIVRYARKSRSDYFIHPALGEFLRSELDFYLKNEFLDVEAMTDAAAATALIRKMHAMRDVAQRIIDMLDEIESFQARLFEKRKFVLESSYLVPIRLVPEDLWETVLEGKEQLDLWRRDFGVDGTPNREWLAKHPTTVVDTWLFDDTFQVALLESLEDIDDFTDGILISSENFGALRTISPMLNDSVGVAYIDPPYNTGSDGFLYVDDFARHSSWLSLMGSRVALARGLLRRTGSMFISIDDHEAARLRILLGSVFGEQNVLSPLVWKSKSGGASDSAHFAIDHEYVIVAAKDRDVLDIALDPEATVSTSYPYSDDRGEFSLERLDKQSIRYSASLDYQIVGPDGSTYRPAHRDPSRPNATWRWAEDTVAERFDELVFKDGNIYTKNYKKQAVKPRSLLTEQRFGRTRTGKTDLRALFGYDVFSNPKPVSLIGHLATIGSAGDAWVLDFFAGSGTTGQAVIAHRRDYASQARFALIEMGEYFDSVLTRRIAKVMYAPEWKEGRPSEHPQFEPGSEPDWVERSPRLVQVIRLESYESSLDSLVADDPGPLTAATQIRYVIPDSLDDAAAMLSTQRLEVPFDYQLASMTEEGERFVDVDLVTTFNLIAGIKMRRYRELDDEGRRYVVVDGDQLDQRVLVVWRSVTGLDPERERSFLETALAESLDASFADYARIWHNADAAIPGGMSLDAEFKRLMFEPEPGLHP